MKKYYQHGVLIGLSCALFFGLWPPAARGAYVFGANPAFIIIATTFARALALLAVCGFLRKNIIPPKQEIAASLKGGLFQAGSIVCLFASLQYIAGPVMIMILFSHTIMLLALMVWKKEMPLTWHAVVLSIAALFGLSFVVDVWRNTATSNTIGCLLAFAGAVFTTGRIYVYGQQLKQKDPAVVGAQAFSIAAIITLVFFLVDTPQQPTEPQGWLWTAVACLASAAGTVGMFYGIAKMGAFNFSMIVKTEPIFTTLFSLTLLGEVLSNMQYIGMTIVIASLASYQYLEHRRQSSAG